MKQNSESHHMVRADSLFPFIGTATHTHTHTPADQLDLIPSSIIARSMRVVQIQCGNVLLTPTVRVSAPHLWTWQDNTVHFHQVLHYMQIDSSIGYARPLSCQPRAQLLGFHNFLGHCCSLLLSCTDLIVVSLSEPHTRESNGGFFTYIYNIVYYLLCVFRISVTL